MINWGSVYLIVKDFDKSIEFYKKLFEKDVAAQNHNRFAMFDVNGFSLSIMNSRYDIENPDKIVTKGARYDEYDNYPKIAIKDNPGKVVINLCTDDLNAEHDRIDNLKISNKLTEIRFINAKNPYYYFSLKDPDDNIIEITGPYEEEKNRISWKEN